MSSRIFWCSAPMDNALHKNERLETPRPYPLALDVTRELMGALEDATRPGQEHLMRKVLEILRQEVLRPGLRLGEADLAVVTLALAELEHEVARPAPDLAGFNRRAQTVMDALAVA